MAMKQLDNIIKERNGRRFRFDVTKRDQEYWAVSLQFPGMVTRADTLDELNVNINELLDQRLSMYR